MKTISWNIRDKQAYRNQEVVKHVYRMRDGEIQGWANFLKQNCGLIKLVHDKVYNENFSTRDVASIYKIRAERIIHILDISEFLIREVCPIHECTFDEFIQGMSKEF